MRSSRWRSDGSASDGPGSAPHEQPSNDSHPEDTTVWRPGGVQGEEWTMTSLSDDSEPIKGKLAQLAAVLK